MRQNGNGDGTARKIYVRRAEKHEEGSEPLFHAGHRRSKELMFVCVFFYY